MDADASKVDPGHRKPSAFDAFRVKNYRLLWTANFLANSGDWLDQVALNWLVITTSGSPVYLGLVNLARGLPIIIFSLIGGVAADRMDRRKQILITQFVALALAATLYATVAYGGAPIWALILLATGRGIVVAFNQPGRHALISELVPRDYLPSAVALNSLSIQSAKILGPLGAAGILSFFGTTACFLVNAIGLTAVLTLLFNIELPKRIPRTPGNQESVLQSLKSGAKYIRNDETLLLLLVVALVPTFFAQPYIQLLALFAHDVFAEGPTSLGVMVATAALGSICGGLFAAWVQREGRRGTVMLTFMGGFGLSLVAFAASPTLLTALPFLFIAGAMHVAYNSSNSTLIQLLVLDSYRGRVLSTLFMTKGLISLGTATIAVLAAMVGPRWALGSMAFVVVMFALLLCICTPKLRKLRV